MPPICLFVRGRHRKAETPGSGRHLRWCQGMVMLNYRCDGALHRSNGLPAVEVVNTRLGLSLLTAYFEHGLMHRDGDFPAVQRFNDEGRLISESFWKRGSIWKEMGCVTTSPVRATNRLAELSTAKLVRERFREYSALVKSAMNDKGHYHSRLIVR